MGEERKEKFKEVKRRAPCSYRFGLANYEKGDWIEIRI